MKLYAEFFWSFFVHVLLVNLLWRTIFRTIKFIISRDLFLLKKFRHTVLKISYVQINRKNFFWKKNFFSRSWSFFHKCEIANEDIIVLNQELISYFLQVWLFNLNTILKTCFKNLLEKFRRNGVFTLLDKSVKPCKLLWVLNLFLILSKS